MKKCHYCGQPAKHQFKNGKWCCSKSKNSCPVQRKINSQRTTGIKRPWASIRNKRKDIRENLSQTLKGRKTWEEAGLVHPRLGKRHTDQTKEKIRQKATGRKHNTKIRKRMSLNNRGKGNPNWKGGLPYCEKCGKQLSRREYSLCKECYDEMKIGEGNPNWNGGSSKLPYAPDWGPKVKRKVFERDGFACQNPECWREDESLVPHHINYDKMNCDSTNLITVCKSCNGRANGNRDYWQKLYEPKIKKGDRSLPSYPTLNK